MALPYSLATFPWRAILDSPLQWLILLPCVSAIVYYLYALTAAQEFFRQPVPNNLSFTPAVSILKPICGLDRQAYKNLASFCQQDYPRYQIIFGVQDPQDSSIAVVQQLMRDFPEFDIQLVIDQRNTGANRKVSNLNNILENAKYNILVLADSDVYVHSDYLKRVVQPLQQPTVGVVTCLYRSVAANWLSAFEALSLSTDYLPGVLVARKLEGMAFALGATIAIKRNTLTDIGGFEAIADYLGDDFQIGHLAANAGHEVVLSDYVVDHVMETENCQQLIRHQLRWNRGIRIVRPGGYAGLLFTYGILSSLLFWVATGEATIGWVLLGITWILRLSVAYVVGVHYLGDRVARQYFAWVPLRDLVQVLLWIAGFFGNTIEWRGHRFRLLRGGKLAPITPASESLARIIPSDGDANRPNCCRPPAPPLG